MIVNVNPATTSNLNCLLAIYFVVPPSRNFLEVFILTALILYRFLIIGVYLFPQVEVRCGDIFGSSSSRSYY